MKQGFMKTISWNKYTSELATQPKNNSLDYVIDQIFGRALIGLRDSGIGYILHTGI